MDGSMESSETGINSRVGWIGCRAFHLRWSSLVAGERYSTKSDR